MARAVICGEDICRVCITGATASMTGGIDMSSIRQERQWLNGFLTVIAFLALGVSSAALADPPSRVARLTQITGAVSFSPAGEDDWAFAQANRPLVMGD